jgi:hypothetical protein
VHAIVMLNCLMVGKKWEKEGERYTGRSVIYHAMQPLHCFCNEGGAGSECDGFGGNGPRFINLDLVYWVAAKISINNLAPI